MSKPVKMISQYTCLPTQSQVNVKSVKEEDTSVPVHVWYNILRCTYPVPSVLEGKFHQFLCTALNKFRNFILRILFQSFYSSFVRYLQTQWTTGTQIYLGLIGPLDITESSSEEFLKDVEARTDCLHYIT